MFTAEKEELEQLGAEITTREIRQQPELWQETVTLYHENQTALENFLKEVQAKAQGKRTRVIFTGAGTSQYVGDTVVPYLRKTRRHTSLFIRKYWDNGYCGQTRRLSD